jgi:hypothetical protein
MSAKKTRIDLPASTNEQVQSLVRRNEAVGPEVRVALPNGQFANISDLIDVNARPGNHTAIFSDTARFLKNPGPGCIYAWVNVKKSAEILGKVRSRMYRIVEIDELKDDEDIPITTHKMGGQQFVIVYDVALVEVQPRAIPELYKWRETLAIQKTVRNAAFEHLRNTVRNATEGRATAELTFKEIENLGSL